MAAEDVCHTYWGDTLNPSQPSIDWLEWCKVCKLFLQNHLLLEKLATEEEKKAECDFIWGNTTKIVIDCVFFMKSNWQSRGGFRDVREVGGHWDKNKLSSESIWQQTAAGLWTLTVPRPPECFAFRTNIPPKHNSRQKLVSCICFQLLMQGQWRSPAHWWELFSMKVEWKLNLEFSHCLHSPPSFGMTFLSRSDRNLPVDVFTWSIFVVIICVQHGRC